MPCGSIRNGHGVDAEPRQALLQPEAGDLRDLVADLGVGDVQVGLVAVEAVQVPLPPPAVVGPVRVLLVGEDDVAGLLLAASRRARRTSRGTGESREGAPLWNHGCSDRGVVDDEVGDHAHPAVVGRAHHLGEVAEGAEAGVDGVEVGDVVAVVALHARGRTASATGTSRPCRPGSRCGRSARRGRRTRRRPSPGTSRRRGSRRAPFFHQRSLVTLRRLTSAAGARARRRPR